MRKFSARIERKRAELAVVKRDIAAEGSRLAALRDESSKLDVEIHLNKERLSALRKCFSLLFDFFCFSEEKNVSCFDLCANFFACIYSRFFLSFAALFPATFWTCPENPRSVLQREQQALDKVADNIETIRKQRADVAQEKDVVSQNIKDLQAETVPLQKDLADLKTRLQSLTTNKGNQEKACVKLQAEVDSAVRKNSDLLAQKTKLTSEAAALEAQNAELVKAKDKLRATNAGQQSELDVAQTILVNTRRLLRTTLETNLASLACVGATVMNQPTLVLDQLQSALGKFPSLFLYFLLEFFPHFCLTISIDFFRFFINFC